MAEQIKIDIFADSSSIKELKQQLLEARNQLSGLEAGSEGFIKVAQRAGELKDQMTDINEQVAIFAGGSKFEQAGTALGQVKDALMNLDFKGASEKAKGLTTIVSSISFKDATAGLKDLSKTFISLGRALLTNPLFLIAAAIAAIVAGVILLMNKFGLLKPILDAIGAAFKFIEGILESVTDWFGLTANAAEDSAERQIAAAEKVKNKTAEYSKNAITSKENEIKIAKSNGEETKQLEYELMDLKRMAVEDALYADRQEIQAKENKLKVSKSLSDEERAKIKEDIEALKQKVKDNKRAYSSMTADMIAFRNTNAKAREDANKKEVEDDAAAAKKAKEDAIRNAKERANTKLQIERQLIDIGLSYLEEGQSKEEAITRENFKRQIQDIMLNEKYTAEQKLKLKLALKEQEENQLQVITDKYIKIEEDKKKIAAEKEAERINNLRLKDLEDLNNLLLEKENLENVYLDSKLSKEDQEINKVRDKYTAIIEAAKKAGEDVTVLEAAQAAEITKIQEDEAEKRIALEESVMSAKFKIAQDTISLISNVTELFGQTNEANAKKAFYIEKALGISSSTIAGIEGTIQAYKTAQKSPITAAFPAYPAIQAGLAAAFAAVNIAKIAATPFGGSGQKASTPNSGSVTTPAQPSFQLFGQANTGNVVEASGNNNQNQTINVNAAISVEQITDTQKKLAQIKQSKTL